MQNTKKLIIDFLYLDLSSCERCRSTDTVIDEALLDLRGKLPNITVNKTQVGKDETDGSFRSPTIRINGKDIEEILYREFKVKEDQKDNECIPCSDVCGAATLCRVYEYRGRDYNTLPKEMIQEAIARVMGFDFSPKTDQLPQPYRLAGNVAKSKAQGCGCSDECCSDAG
ncbi:MAG: DUF2703 domain-containing protein [Nitrospirae bacterium]|nr:DUF2703 domain-containing protein [Nitrospirota bacterium]